MWMYWLASKSADGMVNRVDQTVLLKYGSSLLVNICLPKNEENCSTLKSQKKVMLPTVSLVSKTLKTT